MVYWENTKTELKAEVPQEGAISFICHTWLNFYILTSHQVSEMWGC